MISRHRSAPTAAAMSIECTTSANSTVTCLNSAWVSCAATGAPQPSQNRAPSRNSVPHVRHAIAAVIRPSAASGPQVPIHQRKALADSQKRFDQAANSGRRGSGVVWLSVAAT